eukprot:gene10831-biopygen4810
MPGMGNTLAFYTSRRPGKYQVFTPFLVFSARRSGRRVRQSKPQSDVPCETNGSTGEKCGAAAPQLGGGGARNDPQVQRAVGITAKPCRLLGFEPNPAAATTTCTFSMGYA